MRSSVYVALKLTHFLQGFSTITTAVLGNFFGNQNKCILGAGAVKLEYGSCISVSISDAV